MARAPAGFLDDLLRLVFLEPRGFCSSRLSLAAGVLDRHRQLLTRSLGLGRQLSDLSSLTNSTFTMPLQSD